MGIRAVGWGGLAPHNCEFEPVLRVEAIVPQGRDHPGIQGLSPSQEDPYRRRVDLSRYRAYEMKVHARAHRARPREGTVGCC